MSIDSIKSRFQAWIHSINIQDWDAGLGSLHTTLSFNGNDKANTHVINMIREQVQAIPDRNSSLDMLIVDQGSENLAARLIHSGTLSRRYRGAEVTGEKVEWVEHMFAWFKEGKIARISSLVDVDGLSNGDKAVPRTPLLAHRKPASPVDLAATYRQYIHSINTLTMQEEFPKYCHAHLTHNNRRLSIDEYRLFIEASFENIQGLAFYVKDVTIDVDSQQLAARIEFTGTSVKELMGIAPTGREISLCEHVYYAFDDGKISWVWALLDLEAYRNH